MNSMGGASSRDEQVAAFARDRLEAAVLEYVRGGFQPHDIARLVSEIATELVGQKEWAESITPRRSVILTPGQRKTLREAK